MNSLACEVFKAVKFEITQQMLFFFFFICNFSHFSPTSSPSEHWNYFGIDEALGPVAVSLRREKLEEDKEHGQQYNYRLIFRTREVSHRVRPRPQHHTTSVL